MPAAPSPRAASSRIALLDDRGVVEVRGADAEKLLAGLITNDMVRLEAAPALYAALLSPQGKILFDFFVVKSADGFLLETVREKARDLAKRLSMYKLRADVEIRDASDGFRVAAVWGNGPVSLPELVGARAYPDPRFPALGLRLIVDATRVSDVVAASGAEQADADAYHAFRVGLGVPEGGRDFVLGDTYPHEGLLDQLHGVSFTKGCFVGQEVVSRMQHRTTVRKRVVVVTGEMALPEGGQPVLAGEVEIGRLGSVDGVRGLALLKIDRVAEAQKAAVPITVSGVPLSVEVPPFATFEIEGRHDKS